MKKGLFLAMVAGCAIALGSCGEKFTPLTQEQINAQVDSLVTAQSEAKLQELRAACEAGLEAQVNAKVEALKTAETAEQ